MRRVLAALLAAGFALPLDAAVGAPALAAAPFPEVALPAPAQVSYRWAYASLAAGAGLIGGSFVLARRADETYADYLDAVDPAEIASLYDRTVAYDRWSSAALITGEVLLATGIYLRFLRTPRPPRVSLDLEPGRCGVALRF